MNHIDNRLESKKAIDKKFSVRIGRFEKLGFEPIIIDKGHYYLRGTGFFLKSIKEFNFLNVCDRYSALIGWRDFIMTHPLFEDYISSSYLKRLEGKILKEERKVFGKAVKW